MRSPTAFGRASVSEREAAETAAAGESLKSFGEGLNVLAGATEEASDLARRIAFQLWPAVFKERDFYRGLLAVVLVHAVLTGEDGGLDVEPATRIRIRDLARLPVC